MAYPISDVTRRVVYSGSAGVGPYSFSFEILTEGDIGVYKNTTLLTLTTDYTVTINADGTGSITLVSAATSADTVAIFGSKGIQRSTDFVTGGDLFANSLNDELDAQTIFAQQNSEAILRSLRAPVTDPTTIDMTLPSKADRADTVLTFDTNGNPQATPSADFVSGISGSVLGANYITNNATGDGSTVNFTLSTAPGAKGNLQIYIDGVYQNKASFSLSGTTVTFTEAPPLNASVEFIIGYSIGSTSGDATGIDFTQQGTGAVTTTVAQKLYETVSVKDFGAVGDGVTDDTAAIQAAIDSCSTGGAIVGKAGETYKITDRLFIYQDHGITLDFNGATLLDEVSTTASEWGGTRSPILAIRESTNIIVRNFKYDGSSATGTSPRIISIGVNAGQDIWTSSNDNANYNITVENIIATDIPSDAIFFQVSGNSHDVTIQNVNLFGDCRIGFNAEYSLAPYDDYASVSSQYSGIEDRYGVHAYNVTVRNFNGFSNTTCEGFLRTAGVYNIIFENCYGYDVDGFIYTYSGDRSIYRIGQNVIFNNCSAYASSTASFSRDVVTVVATEDDGSTGGVLPSWTKYDFKTTFNNCEFHGNKSASNNVRIIGNDGATVFNSCVFRDGLKGVRIGGSSGVWADVTSASSEFNNCLFIDNDQDVYLAGTNYVRFNSCKFTDQSGDEIPVYLVEADYNKFNNCIFSGLGADRSYIEAAGTAQYNELHGCSFDAPGSQPSVSFSAITYGSSNVSAGTLYSSGYSPNVMPTEKVWFNTNLFFTTGSGSPEGSVTAVIGSLYTRTDGGASTTLYVKESGTGNTGWVAK